MPTSLIRMAIRFNLCNGQQGNFSVVRPDRLERPTLWFEARCSIQLSYGRIASSYH